MESSRIVYPDESMHSLVFGLNNTDDSTRMVYLHDLTVHSFNINIDYVTNCLSWIERRPPSITEGNPLIEGTTTGQYIYVLCCLRLEPGSYTSNQQVFDAINDALTKIQESSVNTCSLKEITPISNGNMITKAVEVTMVDMQGDPVKIAPAVLDAGLLIRYDLQHANRQDLMSPVTAVLPTCVGIDFDIRQTYITSQKDVDVYIASINNLMHYTDSLTKHTIDFDRGITRKMGITPYIIPRQALIYTDREAIRICDNGINYTEYILDGTVLDELELRKYYLNTLYVDHQSNLTVDANHPQYGSTNPLQFIPFFPYSDTLYIGIGSAEKMDNFIEANTIKSPNGLIKMRSMSVPISFKTTISAGNGGNTITFSSMNGGQARATIQSNGTASGSINLPARENLSITSVDDYTTASLSGVEVSVELDRNSTVTMDNLLVTNAISSAELSASLDGSIEYSTTARELTGSLLTDIVEVSISEQSVSTVLTDIQAAGTINDRSVSGTAEIASGTVIGTIPTNGIESLAQLDNIEVFGTDSMTVIGSFSTSVNSTSTNAVDVSAVDGVTISLDNAALSTDAMDITINNISVSNTIPAITTDAYIQSRDVEVIIPAELITGTISGSITGNINDFSVSNSISGSFDYVVSDVLTASLDNEALLSMTVPDYKMTIPSANVNYMITGMPSTVDFSTIRGTISDGDTPSTVAEYLYYQTEIQPLKTSINTIIRIPPKSTKYIYVIGNNQAYPVAHAPHSLTYSIIH